MAQAPVLPTHMSQRSVQHMQRCRFGETVLTHATMPRVSASGPRTLFFTKIIIMYTFHHSSDGASEQRYMDAYTPFYAMGLDRKHVSASGVMRLRGVRVIAARQG
eukprot:1410490-Pleurochrysis_carterae.AAC.1